MKIRKLTVLSFSPNGTTHKIAKAAAGGFSPGQTDEIDLTKFENRWKLYHFQRDEAVVLALPVYHGRLPLVSDEIFNHLSADGAAAAGITAYAYNPGRALEEMHGRLASRGFTVCGLASFASQSPYDSVLGAGRPSPSDLQEAGLFGAAVFAKISQALEPKYGAVSYAKLEDFRRAVQRPAKPAVHTSCTHCGLCARECPVYAIDPNDPSQTDSFRCILCGRCVNRCPNGSRQPVSALTEEALIARAAHPEPFPNLTYV